MHLSVTPFFQKEILKDREINMKKFILIILLVLAGKTLLAEIFWDGRFYQQSLLLFKQDTEYIGLTVLDLKLDARPSDILRIRSEMEYALLKPSSLFFVKNNSGGVVVNSLNVTITSEDLKFTIGRFLPTWGKGKIFRPLDIFRPQTYFLNMLSFQGVDGFSVKYYLSNLSSVQFIAIPSFDIRNFMPHINPSFTNTINHTLTGLNLETHIATFDNNIIFVKDTSAGNNIAGMAFKGDVVIGIWGEFFYSFDNKIKSDAFRCAFGADYSFEKYFFMSLEYFYDESGMKDYNDYIVLMRIPRMTFGKEYIMFDFNVLTYEELNYGITYLGNLIDKSFILFPYFRCEIIENGILGISLYHFNGKSNREFAPDKYGNYIFNTYLNIRF